MAIINKERMIQMLKIVKNPKVRKKNIFYSSPNLHKWFIGTFLFLLIVLSTPLISAESKNYDSLTKTITIKDNLGIFKLAEYKLTKNTDYCLYQCYAEGIAILFNKNYLFDDVIFEDIKKNKKTIPYSIKIKSGSKWIDYDNKKLDIGTYKWRIEGTKEFYETIDWIGSAYGLSFTEWSYWRSSFDVGLSAYWNFDNRSGTTTNAIDMFREKYNFTIGNSTGWVAGILGNAYSSNNSESINTTFRDDLEGRTNMTINLWIKRTGNWNNSGSFITKSAGATNGFYGLERQTNTNKLQFAVTDSLGLHYAYTPDALLLNQWYMVTEMINSTDASIYINGTLVNSFAITGFVPSSESPYFLSGEDHLYSSSVYNVTIDEMGFWNRTLNNTEIVELYNGGSGLLAFTTLIISLNSPINNLITTNKTITFNCSSIELANFTLFIDGIQNYSLNNSMSFQILQTLTATNHNWSCDFVNENGTDSGSRVLNITNFVENSQVFNATTYETAIENYAINITYTSSYWDSISADLIYNGTSYTGTKTGTGNEIIFSKTLNIPNLIGNKSFYWKIKLTNSSGTFYDYSVNQSQYVNQTIFSICNSTNNQPYINFTSKDETTLSSVSFSIPTSNFTYWLGDGTYKKSFIFINNTENPNFAFCLVPKDRNLKIDYTMNYVNGSYPQRINNPAEETLTNVTTNRTLYLLSSSDGISDTTQVITQSGEALSGVGVIVSREISGTPTIVSQGTTGDDGTISFWLNPDYLHTYTFTKTGYITLTTSFYPLPAGHTVTMGAGNVVNGSDYSIGINYLIKPSSTLLKNNTIYNFNFTLTSTYWVITSFGFNLKNSSGSILASTSLTTDGGIVSANLDTVKNDSIIMDFWYFTNGSYINSSRVWIIYDDEFDNGWSIKNFFTDLSNYAAQGMFGLDDFGLALIIFVTMFLFIGIMSLRFGFTSPATISVMIFALVLFFDVGVGILPAMYGQRVSNFITIFTAIIMVGLLYREWQR